MKQNQLNAIRKNYQKMKSESSLQLEKFKKEILNQEIKSNNYDLFKITYEMYDYYKLRIEKKMYSKDIKELFDLFKFAIQSLNIKTYKGELSQQVATLTLDVYILLKQHRYYSKIESLEDLLEG